MTIFRTALLIAAVATVGGCVAPGTRGTDQLVGTGWRLVEMDGLVVRTPAERPFVLEFGPDGMVSGQACNRMGGEYRLGEQRIEIGPVAMTEMSCGDPLDSLEGRFLQIISAPLAYRFTPEGDLLFGDPGRPALRFLPSAEDGTGRIVTGQWGGDHVGLVLDEAGGTLDYDCASGRIEGPLLIDRRGRFSATGYHTPGTGGPEQQGYVPPRLPAVYSGRVSGDGMTLSVRVPSTDLEIGPLSLRRNPEPTLLRCL